MGLLRRSRFEHGATSELAQWRESRHISLESIASETKIGLRYLEAIESGDFHRLPGGTYSVSYLRQYAHITGYDADRLLDSYNRSQRQVVPINVRSATAFGRVRDWIRHLVALAS